MALLNWSRRRYSVGVAALDDQHAVFIGSLNNLHAAMMQGKGRNVTGPLLVKLLAYAHAHFNAEEELMTSTKYPNLSHHCAEHEIFKTKLEELNARHDRGESAVCIPLLRFMRDWLSTHILEEDREYGPWLNENGVR